MADSGIFICIGIALAAAFTAVFLKECRLPALSLLAAVAGGAVIFLRLLPSLSALMDSYSALSELGGVNQHYFGLIMKIIGVAYVCEFAGQICRDAGQGAIALKLELVGKVAILLLSLPVLTSVVQTVWGLF